MKIFNATTLSWKELGALKWGVFLIGIAVGTYGADLFAPYVGLFRVFGLLLSFYVGFVWLKQHRN